MCFSEKPDSQFAPVAVGFCQHLRHIADLGLVALLDRYPLAYLQDLGQVRNRVLADIRQGLIDKGFDDVRTRYHFLIPPFRKFGQIVMLKA